MLCSFPEVLYPFYMLCSFPEVPYSFLHALQFSRDPMPACMAIQYDQVILMSISCDTSLLGIIVGRRKVWVLY